MLKNEAERCIVDSNYAGALANYKQAFQNKIPNQRDLYNAFVLAYLMVDSTALKSFYKLMVLQGQTNQRLSILRFGKTYKETALYQWVTKDYDSLRAIALQGPVPRYARVMDSIFDADQAVRTNYIKMSQDDIKLMVARDSANLDFLNSWIRREGFPGYQRVGLFDKAPEGWVHSNSAIFFVLWHTRNLSTVLDALMLQAVQTGEFPPEDYAVIMDGRTGNNKYYSRPPKTVVAGEVVFDHIPEAQEREIDIERANIFLCSLKDYKRELEFQNKNKLFYFFSGMQLALAFTSAP